MVLLLSLSHLLAGRSVFSADRVPLSVEGVDMVALTSTLRCEHGCLCRMEDCWFTDFTFQLLLLICVIYTNHLKISRVLEFCVLTFNNHSTAYCLKKITRLFLCIVFFFFYLCQMVMWYLACIWKCWVLMTFFENRLWPLIFQGSKVSGLWL